ncbi:MAG: RNA 2',3'-cyclic phosphodiesterase [Acidobacteriaceae bacterium]
MRLFVAIGLAASVVDTVRAVRDRFAAPDDGLRWSQEESWHVTLQFLGATDDAQTACVMQQLSAVRSAAVPVRIAGLDFFERAGVFHARVELTAELLALQQKVTAATRACGFVAEARAYSPHITLARVKGRGNAKALGPLKAAVERARVRLAAEFVANEFRLYESVPGPDGSRYEVRARFELSS